MRKTEIASRIHSAAIRLLRHVRREDRLMDLSPARASVLSVLVFGGPRSPGELAELEQVAPPTMTKLINGLERDGYVRKRQHPEDARGVVVSASAKAEHTLEEGRQRRIQLLRRLFAELDESEWAVLEQAGEIIHRRLTAP